jgi:hypothetical protein
MPPCLHCPLTKEKSSSIVSVSSVCNRRDTTTVRGNLLTQRDFSLTKDGTDGKLQGCP